MARRGNRYWSRDRALRELSHRGKDHVWGCLAAAGAGGGAGAPEGEDGESLPGGGRMAEREGGPALPGSDGRGEAMSRADSRAAGACIVSGGSNEKRENGRARPRRRLKREEKGGGGAEGEALGSATVMGGSTRLSMNGAAGGEGKLPHESGGHRKGSGPQRSKCEQAARPKGSGRGKRGLLSHDGVSGRGEGGRLGGEGRLADGRTLEGVTPRRSAEQLERRAPPHTGIDGRVTSTETGLPVTACRSLPARTKDPTPAEPRGGGAEASLNDGWAEGCGCGDGVASVPRHTRGERVGWGSLRVLREGAGNARAAGITPPWGRSGGGGAETWVRG